MIARFTNLVSWQEYRDTVYAFNEGTKRVYLFQALLKIFGLHLRKVLILIPVSRPYVPYMALNAETLSVPT